MPAPICFGSLFGISTLYFSPEIVIGIIQIGLHLVSRFIVRSLVLAGKFIIRLLTMHISVSPASSCSRQESNQPEPAVVSPCLGSATELKYCSSSFQRVRVWCSISSLKQLNNSKLVGRSPHANTTACMRMNCCCHQTVLFLERCL